MSLDTTNGGLKEATGDLAGDKTLQREGKLDQVQGAVKDALVKFTDTAKSLVGKK